MLPKIFLTLFRLNSLLVALMLLGCDGSERHKNRVAELLSLPVNSTNSLEVKEFNENMLKDKQAGRPWGVDPVLVINGFTSLGIGQDSAMSMLQGSEGAGKRQVVVINDGFSGDSVRGERFDLVLQKDSEAFWIVLKARYSWRCWPDRGHDDFSTVPCS